MEKPLLPWELLAGYALMCIHTASQVTQVTQVSADLPSPRALEGMRGSGK
jgi:hypothetical protein